MGEEEEIHTEAPRHGGRWDEGGGKKKNIPLSYIWCENAFCIALK
jgi:hypothetical protein